MKSHHDRLSARASFLYDRIRDALRYFALLLRGTPFQHRDLNHWHGTPVVSRRSLAFADLLKKKSLKSASICLNLCDIS
ncbi:MAG TPA: hypothetical protein VK129_09860, partial [Terriglobales bacterium]|nr:hypothetical protein [Terriglobales bacterium]